jgi:hypothetical protein
MPDCPAPSECQLEEDRFTEMSKQPDVHPKLKEIFEDYAAVRSVFQFYAQLSVERFLRNENVVLSQ